jgi:Secretion system C-terminal sorting domain
MNFKQTLFLLGTFLHLTIIAQTPLIDEEFEASTSIPTGWIGSSVSISTNNACAASDNSVAFNGVGDALITPLLVDPQDLKFLYLRSSNTTAWTLNIQYGSSIVGPWTNLGSVNDATNSECKPFSADLSSLSNIYIRFVDARASGANERYIDNVVITQREPLGVSLSEFTLNKIHNAIKLEWSTTNEKDNSHFEIEKSLDGKNFIKIGQVKGFGTTSEIQNYTFLDDKMTNTTAYYRLRQTDFNGKVAFSKIIATNSDLRKGKTRVYPTLVNDWVTVDLKASNDFDLLVSDVVGRVVLSQKVKYTEGGNTFLLDLNGISKGIYFVTLKSGATVDAFKIQKM